MNDVLNIEKFLKSNVGIIYNDGKDFFFLEIEEKGQGFYDSKNDYICFYDLFAKRLKSFIVHKQHKVFTDDIAEEKREKLVKSVNAEQIEKKIYYNDFDTILEKIATGKISKAVWYNNYKIKFNQYSKKQLIFNAIVDSDHHTFIYWNKEYLLLTKSPELLLEKRNETYAIDCIAGTSKVPNGLFHPMLIKEHSNVENHVLRNLQRINCSDISKIKRRHIKYKDFFHWKSVYHFKSDSPIRKIIKSIAPTSAIFGSPTTKTMEVIHKLKYYDDNRSPFYGGLIHIKLHNIEKIIVNIRCIEIRNEVGTISTGCGLIKNSVLDNELSESRLKLNSVLENFNVVI